MSLSIAMREIFVIFGYVLVGWCTHKFKVLEGKDSKTLSTLIIKTLLPLNILASANVETQKSDLLNMFWVVVILLVAYILVSACMHVYSNAKKLPAGKRAAFTGLCVYPNSMFIGLPLCIALMGPRATLFGAAAMISYNLLFFTYQVQLFNPKQKIKWQTFATPLNISTLILIFMLLANIKLPTVVQTVASNVGGMTTPVSLIIIGISLAEHNFASLIKNKSGFAISALRNFAFPLAFMLILSVLPFDAEMKLATLIYFACPCATLTAVFATENNMEAQFCSETILISTLMFAASLPVVLSVWGFLG